MNDPLLGFLIHHLVSTYGCHTVILYGSRARGDFNESSDYDALGILSEGDKVRDAFIHAGAYMDLFVYPQQDLDKPENFLHLHGGQVLLQAGAFGTRFLQSVADRFAAGPEPVPADEARALRVWWVKMLQRARREDIEGNYRRVWLLTSLLEDVFRLRKWWYRGPKESLLWLQQHDHDMYSAYQAALKPQAGLTEATELVEMALQRTAIEETAQ